MKSGGEMTEPERERSNAPFEPVDELPALSTPTHHRPGRVKWIVLTIIVVLSVALDQWSKHWAQNELQHLPGRRVILVQDYLTLSYVRNPGAAWGFLARSGESFRRPFFVGISVVAMIFILYLFLRLERGQRLMMSALSLVMGGAVGNFIDRLRYNYVVDFIDLHFQRRFKWPTFNVADIAITVGVLLLAVEMFIMPTLRRRAARGSGTSAPEGEEAP